MQKNLTRDSTDRATFINNWRMLKIIVESIDIDAIKSADRGNLSAGKRFRHGIRLLKTTAHDLLMNSIKLDKEAAKLLKEDKEDAKT